ncbi:hypothetical protein [Cohnella silvisoli]|uniref:SLATT domain-containing protein n=1 Tax=Cohnella silvisoli TaxID=2873699 RepID=A0ABV1KU52_9BACL|nr:hypothetical protein [Cohnella silvisoli]MCD9023195.1 hypothetical protein [Cohnella silvisoli]
MATAGRGKALRDPTQDIPSEDIDRSELIAWLDTLRRDFDPPLLEARKNYPSPGFWLWPLLGRSLFGLKYKKMSEDSIQKLGAFFTNHITIWTAIGLGVFGALSNDVFDWFKDFQPWPRTIGAALLLFSWLAALKANFTRMLTPGDPYLHLGAYRTFRPKEFFMFQNYLKENKYSFNNVYFWAEKLKKDNALESFIKAYEELNERLQKDIATIQEALKESKLDLEASNKTIGDLNDSIGLLYQQVKNNEVGFNRAIDILYRLRNNYHFTVNDLRIICGFSLFEVLGDDLYMLGEQETTETPLHININDPDYEHYSSVKLVGSESTIEYATADREGRTVASYWIELPSNRVIIYNFHYDSTNVTNRDIIESKEMYRFIRGICIHLDERGLLVRVGDHGEKPQEAIG